MRKKIIAITISGAILAAGVAGAQSARTPELFDIPSVKAGEQRPSNVETMLQDKSAQWAARIAVNKALLSGAQRELVLSMPEGKRLNMRLAKS